VSRSVDDNPMSIPLRLTRHRWNPAAATRVRGRRRPRVVAQASRVPSAQASPMSLVGVARAVAVAVVPLP
jgi:hypothetical protein